MATRLRGGAVSPITGARFHKSFTVFFFFFFNNNFPALAMIFLSKSNWQKVFFFFLCAANPLGCGLFTVTATKKKLCRGKNIIMGSIKPLVFSLHTRSLCACITFLQVRQASCNELKSKRCLPACFAKKLKLCSLGSEGERRAAESLIRRPCAHPHAATSAELHEDSGRTLTYVDTAAAVIASLKWLITPAAHAHTHTNARQHRIK